jgi:uncharacterized protein YdhG (YjbR/CyaY superfamily)
MDEFTIDGYLAELPQQKRETLELLRQRILAVIPEAEQCISYAMPAFRVNGKVLAGFAAFKNHLAYLPHSGKVFPVLADELKDFVYTNGSLHFSLDECLSPELIAKLIEVRREQVGV